MKNKDELTFEEELELETKRAFDILCKIMPIGERDFTLIKKRKVYTGIKRFDPNLEEVGM